MSKRPLAVSATFTAEPLQAPLEHALGAAGLGYAVAFAPYGQVLQTLLDPASPFAGRDGVNVLLVRWEDFGAPDRLEADRLAAAAEELARAVRDSRGWHTRDLVILTTPPSPGLLAAAGGPAALGRCDEVLAAGVRGLGGVHVLAPDVVGRLYPVAAYHDAEGERLGHVPYTAEWFAAAALALVRRLHGAQRAPYKVIVLDCDNTLWRGVVGEDGIEGIALDPPYERLQRFFVAQRESGMLLCLCSKNNEQDVWDTFAAREDFPLRREHIVAWRINWAPKPDNLRELARELDLGLDSFIFVDDNAKECAEMRARCPEVLTLLLPEDAADIPAYLEHVWAFDHWRVTADDRARSAVYGQKLERERLARSAGSFEEFLAGLGLVVDVAPLAAEHLPRVAQLTLRTNQFNTTTVRRSEAEIEALLRAGYECLTVDVRDRFGSYGLVGAALYRVAAGALEVDALILSCRALGRGVEHRVLAHLGGLARAAGAGVVRVPFARTAKNEPARSFLESAGAAAREDAGGGRAVYAFDAGGAAALTYRPAAASVVTEADSVDDAKQVAPDSRPRFDYDSLARELRRPEDVLAAVAHARRVETPRESNSAFVAPRTDVETRLAAIWAEVLGLDAVDVRASFFDLGGTSLLAVQLVSRVIREFGRENLTLSLVLQAPSVEQFSRYVEFEHLPAFECLVALRSGGTRPPLYFVNGAGGNVLGLRDFTQSLPEDQPLYALQPRGLDGSAPFATVRETAEHYVGEIRRHQPEGPYYVSGASYGGLVAFEMAHVLREQGQTVGLLAMMDTYNNAYSAMISRPQMLYYNVRFVAERAGHHLAHAAALNSTARRTYVAEKLHALQRYRRQITQVITGRRKNHVVFELPELPSGGGEPQDYLVEALNGVIRASTQAQRDYVPRRYDGAAVLFRASVPFSEPYRAPHLGWNLVFAPGRITDVVIPGDHNGILSEPNVLVLGEHLAARLRDAHARYDAPEPAAAGTPTR